MSVYNLSDEQAELLAELVDSEGFVILTTKVLPVLLEARVARVLTQTVESQTDLFPLALERAKLDGAKKLAKDIAELPRRKASAPAKRS